MSKIILNGVDYSELDQNRPLIRQSEIEQFVSVHLINSMQSVLGYAPYELDEITCERVEIPISSGVDFDGFHPWIDISWSILNQTSGLHTYVLKFYNVSTYESYSVYFSYIFQTSDIVKDYIYMNR